MSEAKLKASLVECKRHSDWQHKELVKRDKVMESMAEALKEAHDYFDDRADADGDSDGFYPNKEMHLQTHCVEALDLFSALKEKSE